MSPAQSALGTFAALGVLLILAKILGGLAERVRVPAVLAELVLGRAAGNLAPLLPSAFQLPGPQLSLVAGLSEFGVLLLLFLVGLEADIKRLARV